MPEGRCPACGYRLVGLADFPACPECGGALDPGAFRRAAAVRRAHERALWTAFLALPVVSAILSIQLGSFVSGMAMSLTAVVCALLAVFAHGNDGVPDPPLRDRIRVILGALFVGAGYTFAASIIIRWTAGLLGLV